jgi:hypothetical protein
MFPFLLLFGVLVFAFGRKLGEELRNPHRHLAQHAIGGGRVRLGLACRSLLVIPFETYEVSLRICGK